MELNAPQLVNDLLADISAARSVETHNGFVLGETLKFLKLELQAIVVESHYTADGITAAFYLPFDKKTYRITLHEERRQ